MSSPFAGFRPIIDGPVRSKRSREIVPADDLILPSQRPVDWKRLSASASCSMAIHAIILLMLSFIIFELPDHNVLESIFALVVGQGESSGDDLEFDLPLSIDTAMDAGEEGPASDDPGFAIEELAPLAFSSGDAGSISGPGRIQSDKPASVPQKAVAMKPATVGKSTGKKGTGSEGEGQQHGDHFLGRSPMGKAALLKRMGGTDASEAAVGRGLVWLKNHQLPDGSWNFFHLLSPRCDCSMPGRLENNPNAATAMALLAFLGAGHTHESGEYQDEVRQGIDFLLAHGTPMDKGISFYGQLVGSPTFYTHGLVTIALSEAYAMTQDARLRPAISGAVDFLVATQDIGGGWRYFPGDPGDTSVVAWQLMALKSAQFSRIMVPQKVLNGVDKFLSSVASGRGSEYAYMPGRRGPTPSMTAAGLLCRMYLDWKEGNGGLRAGVRFLDQHGPEPDDMYYNYYATQVLHHWGGPEWDRWNNTMREHLVRSQIRLGHAAGSWDVADRHGIMGGRLYMTSLALLTLEVYYRHLPLYQRDRIEMPLVNPALEAKPR